MIKIIIKIVGTEIYFLLFKIYHNMTLKINIKVINKKNFDILIYYCFTFDKFIMLYSDKNVYIENYAHENYLMNTEIEQK